MKIRLDAYKVMDRMYWSLSVEIPDPTDGAEWHGISGGHFTVVDGMGVAEATLYVIEQARRAAVKLPRL